MSNTFGKFFRVTTFGESHGKAMGCVVDGCPAGLALDPLDFGADMARRRPGQGKFSSPRKEMDEVEILSGVFEGVALGTPIALLVHNHDQKPQDYAALKDIFRPGHADFTHQAKYGIRDHRGGGRASGRETVARVAAGVIAKKILTQLDVSVSTHVYPPLDEEMLQHIVNEKDSLGSSVKCEIIGLKAGIGQPVFGKLSADLMGAIASIGGVRGVEISQGIKAATMRGSHHNPIDKGVLGGISDGEIITLQAHFKPPSSIGIGGRHDAIIAPRAAVVVEAMAALVVVDHIFASFSDTMDGVVRSYK
ncbi:MAG: chorismate synthase [Defluviitaleaceae bacterium]|nr:chorismate synthase [Defluviitaleaceae bacterium]